MKIPSHISCLLLLSFGTCFPTNSIQVPANPGEEVVQKDPGLWETPPLKWRRSPMDLSSLFSIAKELQSFGKEKAGIQFRFGRRDTDENPNAVKDLLEEGGEKGASSLEALAEELNGYYNGKKAGFSIWFGRRKREAFCARGTLRGAPKL
ncbi:orexigenic neuropeptide QRFP [Liasis olivaceus]